MNKFDWIVHGINYREIFPYHNEEITIRPLSIFEVDEAYAISLEGLPCQRTTQAIFKLKEGKEPNLAGLDMSTLQRFSNMFDYVLVSMSTDKSLNEIMMKPADFPVHKIAKRILVISGKVMSKQIVIATLRTMDGKSLAHMVCHFHQPLAKVAEMTQLQYEFIFEGGKDRRGILFDATTPWQDISKRLDSVYSPIGPANGPADGKDSDRERETAGGSAKGQRRPPSWG